jgi:hypothetical protein
MDAPVPRLTLGIATVAVVVALCATAIWAVRGHGVAPETAARVQETAPARNDDARLKALGAQVRRLQGERDAALAKVRELEGRAAPAVASAPAQRAAHAVPAAQPAAGFGESQTFGSLSTSQ